MRIYFLMLLNFLLLILSSCQLDQNSDQSTVLVVKSNGEEKKIDLDKYVGTGFSCSVRSGNREKEIDKDLCLMITIMFDGVNRSASELKILNAKVERLTTQQNGILQVAIDATLIAAASAEVAKTLETESVVLNNLIRKINGDVESMNLENKKFLVELAEQYRQLNVRIDRSVPNYDR